MDPVARQSKTPTMTVKAVRDDMMHIKTLSKVNRAARAVTRGPILRLTISARLLSSALSLSAG